MNVTMAELPKKACWRVAIACSCCAEAEGKRLKSTKGRRSLGMASRCSVAVLVIRATHWALSNAARFSGRHMERLP